MTEADTKTNGTPAQKIAAEHKAAAAKARPEALQARMRETLEPKIRELHTNTRETRPARGLDVRDRGRDGR